MLDGLGRGEIARHYEADPDEAEAWRRRAACRQQLGDADGVEFCRNLPHQAGVVAIPNSVFYDDPEAGRTQVRFAFCKQPEVLQDALDRIEKWARHR